MIQNCVKYKKFFPSQRSGQIRVLSLKVRNLFTFVSSARSSLRNHVPLPIRQPICQFSFIPSHTTVGTAVSPEDWCFSISATESSSYTQLTLMQSMQQTKKCNMYHMTERTYIPRRPCSLLASQFPTTRLRSRSCAREPWRRNIDVSLSIIL